MIKNSSAACAIGVLLSSFIPVNEAFVSIGGAASVSLFSTATGAGPTRRNMVQRPSKLTARRSSGAWSRSTGGFSPNVDGMRHLGVVRRRSETAWALGAEGGADGDMELEVGEEGTGEGLDLAKDFYSEMASRWNTTVEGAIEKEKDILMDRTIYDELRERRDFGLEQDLGLELQKRNITQQREATKKDLDDGLESLPGVSSATTFVPSSDLTPRDVISAVLEALKNKDQPYPNHGLEVFMRFLSPTSALHGIKMPAVARYLAEERNHPLMNWTIVAYPRPLTYAGGPSRNKAFQRVQIRESVHGKWHPVNFTLALHPRTGAWLIESFIMKGDL